MDLIDKKILCELDADCRAPFSQIAKKLRINRNVAAYRISNLEKEGVIAKYICSINLGALGYKMYKIDIKLHKAAPPSEREIASYLTAHHQVIHCVKTEGFFDYSFVIATKNLREVEEFLSELKNRVGEIIQEYTVSIVTFSRIFKLDKLLLGKQGNIQKFESYYGEGKEIEIDEKDKKILRIVSQQANISLVQLAQKTGLSLDIVKYRLNELRKKKIGYFRIMLDLNKLGYYHYTVLLRIRQATSKEEDRLIGWCTTENRVIYYTKRIGYHEVAVNIAIKDLDDLNEFLQHMKQEFSPIIDSYQVMLNTKLLKLNYVPL